VNQESDYSIRPAPGTGQVSGSRTVGNREEGRQRGRRGRGTRKPRRTPPEPVARVELTDAPDGDPIETPAQDGEPAETHTVDYLA